MELLNLIGLGALVFFGVIGGHRIIMWTISGYRLEQKHIRLGQGCVLLTDDELREVRNR